MIHIAHKVMPVGVLVNETSAIDVKLEESLESTIYYFEVVGVTFYFDHIEMFHLGQPNLRLIISLRFWLRQYADLRTITLLERHILLKLGYLLAM